MKNNTEITGDDQKNSSQRQPWTKIVWVIISLVIIIIFTHSFDMEKMKTLLQKDPLLSRIIGLAVYFLTSFTFIPSSPITIFLAMLNGPVSAIAIATLGNTLAALVQYHIGTTLTEIKSIEEKQGKLPPFLQHLPMNSPFFLLIGRLLPGGIRGMSIICGYHHVHFFTFLWTTTTMNIVSAAFLALGGTSLLELLQKLFPERMGAYTTAAIMF
jgi:uncharacterized membrane protein YdjX (TVP38/TMEM64 family)